MPFPPDQSNIKLRASGPSTGQNPAVSALRALNRDGLPCKIVGVLPGASLNGHCQGLAFERRRLNSNGFLTTSVEKGKIIIAGAQGVVCPIRSAEPLETDPFDHPGGIQTIGSHLVVPVYKQSGESSEIRFYRYQDDELQPLTKLTISIEQKAYCVGVTNYSTEEGEFYLLAVCVHNKGDELKFYRGECDKALSETHTPFTLIGTWNFHTDVTPADRADWKPDDKWGGYSNNFSLFSDTAGHIYFLGLHKTSLILGRDYADLYRLDLNASKGKWLTKLANFHARCHNGTSFRWGASASVVDETSLRLFACERDVQSKDGLRDIRLNSFA